MKNTQRSTKDNEDYRVQQKKMKTLLAMTWHTKKPVPNAQWIPMQDGDYYDEEDSIRQGPKPHKI